MICLLCPAIAVADCLCVPCGAKLWACELWRDKPAHAHVCSILAGRTQAMFNDINAERWVVIRYM